MLVRQSTRVPNTSNSSALGGSDMSLLRGRPLRALLERGAQVSRPAMLVEEVAKRLVGKLLPGLHRIARQEINGVPSFFVELNELAPDAGRLLRGRHVRLHGNRPDHDDSIKRDEGREGPGGTWIDDRATDVRQPTRGGPVALKVEFHNYVDEHDYLIDGEDIEIMPPGHLKAYGVTRKLLRQIFKKAAPMMEGQDPERVRVCADMGMDG